MQMENHNHLYNLTLPALGPTLDVRIEFYSMTPFKIHLHGHIRYKIKLIDKHITNIIYTEILGYTVCTNTICTFS